MNLLALFAATSPALIYYLVEALALSYMLARRGTEKWVIALVIASTFAQVVFLFTTNIYMFEPDNSAHIDYIQYLIKHNFIPPVPSGWHRQQPPLYYEWCAAAYMLGQWLGVSDKWFCVRIASRLLYLAYMVFSVLFIERFRFPTLAKCAALALVLFWPIAYMVSTRTNNDLGFMAFFMAMAFFLQDWHERLSHKSLLIALFCASLSLLCKGTGVISLTVAFLVILHTLLTRRISLKYFYHPSLKWLLGFPLAALAIYFGRLGYYILIEHKPLYWFANVHVLEVIYTPATFGHFIHLNLWDFVNNPGFYWTQADRNFYSFWDFLFRSLLFSTEGIPLRQYEKMNNAFGMGLDKDTPYIILKSIGILWLVIFIMAIAHVLRCFTNLKLLREYVVPLAAFFSLLILLMIQRSLIADKYLANGRYIYPIVTIVAVLMAAFCARLRQRGHKAAYILFCGVPLAFAAISEVLTLYSSVME